MKLNLLSTTLATALVLSGCDSMHNESIIVSSPTAPAQKISDESLKILDSVAAEYKFTEQPISFDYTHQGYVRIYTRSYAKYPERGMYCHLTLKARRIQNNDSLEISLTEFVASEESEFSTIVRQTIERRIFEKVPQAKIGGAN